MHILFIGLLILKLSGALNIGWGWVFSPLLITLLVVLIASPLIAAKEIAKERQREQ